MSGALVKARQVRLEGARWLDTDSPRESLISPDAANQSRQSLQVFHRRIEDLKTRNGQQTEELEELRLLQEQRMAQSRDEGFFAGVIEGRRQMSEELEEAFRLLADHEREFRRAAADYHATADRELVRLARWMAEAVLRRELPLDEDLLARQVQALLEAHQDHQVLRLHLHPGDHRRLTGPEMLERHPRLAELLDSLRGRLEWVQAADIPPGACRVALHDGLLDATPIGILDHLEQSLTTALNRGGGTSEKRVAPAEHGA